MDNGCWKLRVSRHNQTNTNRDPIIHLRRIAVQHPVLFISPKWLLQGIPFGQLPEHQQHAGH
jgi:hypothetical protein